MIMMIETFSFIDESESAVLKYPLDRIKSLSRWEQTLQICSVIGYTKK